MSESTIQMLLFARYCGRSVVIIPNYTPPQWHECDLFQVTRAMHWVEFEVKTSVPDFLADSKKVEKHYALANMGPSIPRRFWYVMPEEIAAKVEAEIPEYAGLMLVRELSGGRGHVLHTQRDAPALKSTKISDDQLPRLYERFYWRYWKQRQTIINLRRGVC